MQSNQARLPNLFRVTNYNYDPKLIKAGQWSWCSW